MAEEQVREALDGGNFSTIIIEEREGHDVLLALRNHMDREYAVVQHFNDDSCSFLNDHWHVITLDNPDKGLKPHLQDRVVQALRKKGGESQYTKGVQTNQGGS